MTKTTRYRIKEKMAIDQKVKACNNEPIKMERQYKILRVYCSVLAFEGVRGILKKY